MAKSLFEELGGKYERQGDYLMLDSELRETQTTNYFSVL